MRKNTKLIVVAVSAIALLGIGTVAFAGWGMGYGPGPRGMGHGYGAGPGSGWNCPKGGPGMAGHLDAETAQKLNNARQAFFQETAGLREGIQQKRQALHYALSAENPDPESAAAIQEELSGLKAQFDQKRIAHRIEMRKNFPDIPAGYGDGYGRSGMGSGRMMGHGKGMGYGCRMGFGPGMHGGW